MQEPRRPQTGICRQCGLVRPLTLRSICLPCAVAGADEAEQQAIAEATGRTWYRGDAWRMAGVVAVAFVLWCIFWLARVMP